MITLLLLSIVIFVVDLLRALLVTKQVLGLKEQQRVLLAKSAQLNKEAAKLTSPDTFAQCAKLQRTAIFNEKQAEKLGAQQVLVKKHRLVRVASPVKLCICLVAAASLWGRPAAHIDVVDIWPLTRWLSGFSSKGYHLSGSVAVAPYLAVTQVVSHALVRVIIPDAWT